MKQICHEDSETAMRCAIRVTDGFKGLGWDYMSPFFSSDEVSLDYGVHIVIYSGSREQAKERLERWRYTLGKRRMHVSRSKTEHLCL